MKKIIDFPVVRDQLAREAEAKAKQAAQPPIEYARAPSTSGAPVTSRPAAAQAVKQ
jgi:hypothetical protein